MSAEDPVVRRRKSRDLRRSRDISDETGAADRDTRRRSSTDGGVLNSAETPRLLREVSNMRLVVIGVMVTVPYTRAFASSVRSGLAQSAFRRVRIALSGEQKKTTGLSFSVLKKQKEKNKNKWKQNARQVASQLT